MAPNRIELGHTARDIVTGFTGIVVIDTLEMTNNRRITLQPKAKEDGTLPDPQGFDEVHCEFVDPGHVALVVEPVIGPDLRGHIVQDTVTQLVGTAIARHISMSGCVQWDVQGAVPKDGKVPLSGWFDQARLIDNGPSLALTTSRAALDTVVAERLARTGEAPTSVRPPGGPRTNDRKMLRR